MDASAFDECGRRFCDFLLQQIALPPDAKCALGFLGQGVALDPESFLSNGEFNMARINAWLNIVAEPLASVGHDDNRVDPVPFTAYKLMDSVCNLAMTLAPAGSDAQQSFAKVKSRAAESLGGATTVDTAPIDWYDPKHLPEWAKCSLTTADAAASGASASATPPGAPGAVPQPPRRSPLWAWRTLESVHLSTPAAAEAVAPDARMQALSAVSMRPPMMMMANRAAPIRAFQVPLAMNVFMPSAPLATLTVAAAPRPAQMAIVHVDGAIAALTLDRSSTGTALNTVASRVFVDHALAVSEQIAAAGDHASTSSVASSSLTMSLNYRVVQLSRDSWWNDMLLLLDNWYIPGLHRGSLVGDAGEQKIIGVPIALVLTSNVQIETKWSEVDRSSASSSTHIGPWALESTQFSQVDSQGTSKLTIPGIQAVACIYRALPVLPPQGEPEPPSP